MYDNFNTINYNFNIIFKLKVVLRCLPGVVARSSPISILAVTK